MILNVFNICVCVFFGWLSFIECIADIKTSTSCEGHKFKLQCAVGETITVKSANYGRTDGHTCVDYHVRVQNCRDENSLNVVSQNCNNKQTCSFIASNEIFSDRCVGTYKYLTVQYQCIPDIQTSTACEGQTINLQCAVEKTIIVKSANYGRTDKNTCPHSLDSNQNCHAENSLNVASHNCNNKQICSIHASNEVFGDPCFGTYKYLTVQYQCIPAPCPPLISSSVDINCTLAGNPVACSQRMREGTVARSTCKHFYEQVNNLFPISTCTNGSWDNPIVKCTPECGIVSDGESYVVNGQNAKKGEFPWHLALYRLQEGSYDYQCGGSIISPLVIITAAHCFTEDGVTKFPAQEFYIGAGKYNSDYNSENDKYVQKRQIKEYHVPVEFRGYDSSYSGDLAVAVVMTAFQITHVVQPICVDWDNKIEYHPLTDNTMGSVVGWGYVDPNTQKVSEELKKLNAPYIDKGQCLEKVPANFRRWITTDKFCAGLTNGSSVCRGDSGGGLVFKWKNGIKYYIRGLVSVGPAQKGTCNNFHYGVYTKISFYSEFILNILRTNQVKD